MIDIIRPKILNNTKVEYWYRQNIFVFIEKKLFNEKYSHLEGNIYSDELYIINKDIIKNPFIFFEKYYNQRIIKFTKKI
jgi:hypothetical protein